MPYAKFDDRFPEHRKVFQLSGNAFRVHVQGIIWCARYLTDGLVLCRDLGRISAPVRRYTQAVDELLTLKLWTRHDPDTLAIHDYLDWNISAARWRAEQEGHRTRQQRYRSKSDASRPPSPDASRDAGRDGAPDQTRPDQGGEARARSAAAPTGPPPPRCPQHLDTPATGPCGPCGDARRTLEAWQLRDAERRRTTPQCPRHRGWPADNCGPCRSERLAADDEPQP